MGGVEIEDWRLVPRPRETRVHVTQGEVFLQFGPNQCDLQGGSSVAARGAWPPRPTPILSF